MTLKYIFSVLTFMGLLGGGSWYVLDCVAETDRPHAPTADRCSAASSDDGWLQGVGYVEPASEIRRLVFQRDGVIAECRVAVGALCKGDVLMALQNREQKAAVTVAEADLALAVAEQARTLSGAHPDEIAAAGSKVALLREKVDHGTREYNRAQKLFSKAAVSDVERQQARTQFLQEQAALKQAEAELCRLQRLVRREDGALAHAKVERARAALELGQQRYRDTLLIAPMDGTVLEILKREGEGQRLIDKEPALIIGDMSRLRLRVEVDERQVRRLKVGQAALVFGRGLGQATAWGRIAEVRPMMGKKTVFSHAAAERQHLDVLQVLIDLDPDFTAPVGLQVDVKIRAPERTCGS